MPHEVLPRSLDAVRAMSPGRRLAAGGVLLVVFAALGYWVFGASSTPTLPPKPPKYTPDEFRPTKEQWGDFTIKPVEIVTFHSEESTEGKIAVNEDRQTPVFSPYSGRVTRLVAQLGQHVERGDPLFAIDATENVQALNSLIAAAAQVNKVRSQFNLAKTNEHRAHELYDAKAGSLKDWQQAQSDLVGAQNDLNSAEIALAAARNQLRILGRNPQEIDQAEKTLHINAETAVASPISGTVTERKVGLGQYLTAGGSDPVYRIGDLSTVWLVAAVKETDAPKIHLGAAVEVRVLAFPGRTFSAHITYIAPSVDPATRRVAVRAEVENADGALKPEMFASFVIITGADIASPAVPQSAVIYEGDNARVWTALPDRVIASRRITTGITSSDGMVQVLAGLEPGDQVVTKGSLFIDRAAASD
ncbi:MAG TPA: efflux RND transporter periplasmic adaptor subunit [Alphaproteobacteria bacterium]|nr:efflux RND transporter periplasmic adaptor subunit [Alphaproteobacteria bacterium]